MLNFLKHQPPSSKVLEAINGFKNDLTDLESKKSEIKSKIGEFKLGAIFGDKDSVNNLANAKQKLIEIDSEIEVTKLGLQTTESNYQEILEAEKQKKLKEDLNKIENVHRPEAIREFELSEEALNTSVEHCLKGLKIIDKAFSYNIKTDGTLRPDSPLGDLKMLHAWLLVCRKIGSKHHKVFNGVIRTLTPMHEIQPMAKQVQVGFDWLLKLHKEDS